MLARAATYAFALAALLALPGCGGHEDADPAGVTADPLIYEIASAGGEVEGWMLGTIHALPDGVEWRTPVVTGLIDDADLLMVEVAGLDDRSGLAITFGELATTEGLGPLEDRIDPALREPLGEILARSDFPGSTFANTESWAAAIMLSQVDAYGVPANGVDRALIRAFAGRTVRGFETTAGQLGVFDTLAEADQRDLLEGTVREWQEAQANPGRLTRAWIAGDLAALEAATGEGILADPELREALLTGRNRAWMPALLSALEDPARPLVAVGTAHLVGPDGLAAMLESEGYTVRRIE